MYLNGEFGDRPDDVNAYAASAFFAVDPYASYKKVWQKEYEQGKLIIADRYVTSNAIHQASKLKKEERGDYLNWLFEFEYRLLGLPEPDMVFFLDMPPAYARQLIQDRIGKTEDIHESDQGYLKKCYEAACDVAQKWGWKRINCIHNGTIRND